MGGLLRALPNMSGRFTEKYLCTLTFVEMFYSSLYGTDKLSVLIG